MAVPPNLMMNMMPPHMLAQFGMPHMMQAMNPMQQFMPPGAAGMQMMPPPHQMIPPRPLFPAAATSSMNQPMSQPKPTFPAYRYAKRRRKASFNPFSTKLSWQSFQQCDDKRSADDEHSGRGRRRSRPGATEGTEPDPRLGSYLKDNASAGGLESGGDPRAKAKVSQAHHDRDCQRD